MRQFVVHILLPVAIWGAFFAAACSREIFPPQPCEACLPCQECVIGEDDQATCISFVHKRLACVEGSPHWFDACGADEGVAEDCTANEECVEGNGVAQCECRGSWTGKDCQICPDAWDPAQDCSLCLPGYDPETGCKACLGNFELSTNCTTCRNLWSGDNCDICPANIDAQNDCYGCANNWYGVGCDICPDNFSEASGCEDCSNHWTGAACHVCPAEFTMESGCTECAGRWTGTDCDECPANFDGTENCSTCANAWTGVDCDVCPSRFTVSSNCSECVDNWTGADCDVCPPNVVEGSGCVECANYWYGDHCALCPEGIDPAGNCLEDCTGNWSDQYGSGCTHCINHYDVLSACTDCEGNYDPSTSCTACLPGFGGFNCLYPVTACVRRVDLDSVAAAPDGLSWGTAFKKIQDGIDSAYAHVQSAGGAERCQVWVSADGYFVYETSVTDTLRLRSGVEVHGGFSGSESTFMQWDSAGRTTLLAYNPTINSLQVNVAVTGADDAVFDGFTVVGKSDTSRELVLVLNDHASPTISNSSFPYGGSSGNGGAFRNISSSPLIRNCQIAPFSAANGGAMYNLYSSPVIKNTNFAGGSSCGSTGGGVIFNDGSTVVLDRCRFEGGNAGSVPGASGGGLYNIDSVVTILDSFFGGINLGNVGARGGWMYNERSDVRVENTVVAGSSLAEACDSGLVHNVNSTFEMRNSVVRGGSVAPICSVSAVIWSDNPVSGQTRIVNSIFWEINNPVFVVFDTPQSLLPSKVSYSVVPGGFAGAGNLDVDPMMEDGSARDYYQLHHDSPCIDAGDGDLAPVTDQGGHSRKDDPAVANTGVGTPAWTDIGCYEFQP